MPSFLPGSPREQLSLAGGPPSGPGGLLGVEHEYRLSAAGCPVDFRDLLPGLAVEGKRLDPGDRNAYRLPSGLALTCDEGEAEVATPPISVRPGFAEEVVAWAQHGRSELARVLPAAHELTGYSTHLSAAMPGADGDEVADLYARTFAPALALLLERPESQGLYVRPRPGRLELCGEFVEGSRLGAVAAFVAGSSRAAALAVAGHGTVPPAIALQTLPAIERYGLRVTRYAAGIDLYAQGRAAQLPLANGGTVAAQEYLEAAWIAARGALGRRASNNDTVFLDRMVAGALPLGVETPEAEPCPVLGRRAPSSPLGQVIRVWRRPGFVIQATVATWDFTVFCVAAGPATVFVNIPRQSLAGFIARVDAGQVDRALRAALESAATRPLLSGNEQTRSVGVFSGMGEPADLLPVERAPESGQANAGRGPRAGKLGAGAGRPGKSNARPWKLVLPLRPPTTVSLPLPGEGAAPPSPLPPLAVPPPLPSRPAGPLPPSQAPLDSPPALPPASTAPPVAGGGIPWLLATGVAAVVLAIAAIAGAVAVNGGGAEPTPTAAPVATLTSTPPPTKAPTETPVPSTPTPTPTATPKADAAATSPSPTSAASTSAPVAAPATATPTATAPTEPTTPVPTATPTRFATETPRPTFTPTPTPTPTATRVPVATPTLVIEVPPTVAPTAPAGCTPAAGVACP